MVANTSWNIYNFRLNVIRRLLEEGYRVSVLAPVDEYVRYTEEFRELEHLELRYLDRDSTNPWKDFRLFAELYRIYRKLKPDLILHYTVKPNIYGGFAAGLQGLASIAVVTGLGYPFIHSGWASLFTRFLYRTSNRFHQRVIFENEDDRILFEGEKLLSAEKGISIKGCGVDTGYFSPRSVKSNGHTIFTFIGRLLYDKGIREFVDAAHELKKKHANTKFWLIGQLDDENPSAVSREDLVKWVKDPDILYLGSKQDVRPYIAQSDCIVLPSYREAIARSLTEAMAMAKPVIGTDTAGVREAIVHGQNGFLVKVKDVHSLTRAMSDFLELNETERNNMGVSGREIALSFFDDKKIADEIVSIIKDVIET